MRRNFANLRCRTPSGKVSLDSKSCEQPSGLDNLPLDSFFFYGTLDILLLCICDHSFCWSNLRGTVIPLRSALYIQVFKHFKTLLVSHLYLDDSFCRTVISSTFFFDIPMYRHCLCYSGQGNPMSHD